MTKPITSVAAMILYEEGAFELTDPVSKFIPSFADVRVFSGGSDIRQVTVPATEPVRIWHLLTHTSGLTYGFHRSHPVDALYRGTRLRVGNAARVGPGGLLRHLGRAAAAVPAGLGVELLGVDRRARPRGRGRVGLRARRVLRQPDLRAAWHDRDRLLAARGRPRPPGRALHDRPRQEGNQDGHPRRRGAKRTPVFLGGGGGLVSTAADYHRFTSMLLGTPGSPAGQLEGVTLLSPRTVAFMTTQPAARRRRP